MKCKISKLFFLTLIGAISLNGYSQNEAERKQIIKDYDLKALNELSKKFDKEYKLGYSKALEIAKQKNLPIEGTTIDGSYFSLVGVDKETGELLYNKAFNNGATNSSVQTARTQNLYDGGSLGINIQGQGMILGIWDGGQPQASHQNLGVSRVTNKDNASATSAGQKGVDHATHVAGTMIGSGVGMISARGLAFQGYLWANNWENDITEMTAQAAQGLLVSNHSYGTDNVAYINNPQVFGRYNESARTLDVLMFQAEKYLPVIAAGNDRQGTMTSSGNVVLNPSKGGFDLMVNNTVSKNAVVVAAINGFTEYTTPTAVIMSDFSQWGPTDDFRVKPDISAKGVGVFSSNMEYPTSVNGYASYPGTSMAAPAVTAVFALWQQYFNQLWPSKGFMRSASVRALMAHTANPAKQVSDGIAPGPNPKYGWGVINAEGGAKVLKDAKQNKAVFQENVLHSGETYELLVTLDGSMPLTATIAWLDKEANVVSGPDNTNSLLVNDLDLRVIRPISGTNATVFPYALNKSYSSLYPIQADNNVDNIEKIEY